MKIKYLRALALAVGIYASLPAQTLEETKAYILQELPQVMNPAERVEVVGFRTPSDSPLLFITRQVSPLDGATRAWLFPIHAIDVYIEQDRYGAHLRARARAGQRPLACYSGDTKTVIPYANIVAAASNPTKLKKLEKAFNHLITLVTGRTELF